MTERLEVESPKEPLLPVDLDADFDRCLGQLAAWSPGCGPTWPQVL